METYQSGERNYTTRIPPRERIISLAQHPGFVPDEPPIGDLEQSDLVEAIKVFEAIQARKTNPI